MSSQRKKINTMPIRAYSLKQIASLYCVSKQTFKIWLKPFEKEIGKRIGHFYSVKQIKIILDKLGTPDGIEDYE
jgi:transposase